MASAQLTLAGVEPNPDLDAKLPDPIHDRASALQRTKRRGSVVIATSSSAVSCKGAVSSVPVSASNVPAAGIVHVPAERHGLRERLANARPGATGALHVEVFRILTQGRHQHVLIVWFANDR